MRKIVSVLLMMALVLSSMCFTALAATEVYITAADAKCTKIGEWGESTNPGCLGPNKENSWYSTSKSDSVIYSASKLEKGSYGVYVYRLLFGNTAKNWDITVTASGSAKKVKINPLDGEQGQHKWVYVGNYEFDGNANDSVKMQISEDAGTGCIRTVAVKFVKDDKNTAAPEIIGNETPKTETPAAPSGSNSNDAILSADGVYITATDSECTKAGDWLESTNAGCLGPKKENSWYSTSKSDSVIYSASKLEKGSYGVYVYRLLFGNTAKNWDIIVTASGSAKKVKINPLDGEQGQHKWVYVGNYEFDGNKNDSVKMQISEDAGTGCIRTVAVKFVKDDKNTAAPEGEQTQLEAAPGDPVDLSAVGTYAINNTAPGATRDEKWTKSGVFTPQGATYYSSVDGASGSWPVNIKPAKNVEVGIYGLRSGAAEDPAAEVEVFANGKATKVIVDFTTLANDYHSLGQFDFAGDGKEYVKITRTSGQGTTRLTWIMLTDTNYVEDPSAFFGTDLHILERMGMLIGEGNGITEEYLKKVPTRVQAAIMVLRLNGVDKEAAAFTGTDNFADSDLEPWASAYLAYLKAHPEFGLIGTGDNMFEPTANIDEQAYAKILLTALGYEYNVDFTWDETLAFAAEKGIAKAESGSFNVNDLAIMTVSALNLNCKSGKTLLEEIIAKRDGIKAEGVVGAELTPELKAARTEAKNKQRFIYNNDGNDVYQGYANYPGPFDASHLDGTTINTENFLKPRSYGLEDTQVSTVFYCTGVFNNYHHTSTGITDTRYRDWAPRLKEFTGKDSLETMVEYIHSIDKEIFWSMRVNDTHDYNGEESHLTPWKQEHLDYLMYRKADLPKMRYGDNRWSAVDFTINEVRQQVYDIFEDVLTRYDVDGLELDLTRWPLYFKEVTKGYDIYPENVERMNNLIRTIRDLTEKVSLERGKPILLAMYVPDSIGACAEIGLDVKKWLDEDLIDIVSIGGSPDENQAGSLPANFQSYKNAVAEYDSYDVPVYIVMDELGYIQENHNEIKEAALMYEAGADGIYLYNYFKVGDEIFKKLGTKETTGPVDPTYVSAVRKQKSNMFKGVQDYLNFD